MREPTDAERAYFQKTQAELAAALPAAPPDFKRTDTPPDFRAAPRMPVQCRDQKVGLFDIGVIGDDLYTHPRTPGEPEAGTVRSYDVRITVNMRQPPPSGSTPKGDDGAWGTPTATRNADPKVHNGAFGVNGPEGPARKALLDLVDTAWLQALVGRPLPEVGASEAQAGRQAERATAAAAGRGVPAGACARACAAPEMPAPRRHRRAGRERGGYDRRRTAGRRLGPQRRLDDRRRGRGGGRFRAARLPELKRREPPGLAR